MSATWVMLMILGYDDMRAGYERVRVYVAREYFETGEGSRSTLVKVEICAQTRGAAVHILILQPPVRELVDTT
jgi:hypothetical protein